MLKIIVTGNNVKELKSNFNSLSQAFGADTIKDYESILDSEVVVGQPSPVIMSEPVEPEITQPPVLQEVINATTESQPVNTNVDIKGLVWDKRIHAATKTKKANGEWKSRRNLDPAFKAQVEAELLNNASQPLAVVPTPPTSDVVVTPIEPVGIDEQTKAISPVTEAPVMPLGVGAVNAAAATPIPVPVVNQGHTLDSFLINFPLVIGQLITDGKITQDYVEQLKSHFGIPADGQIWNASNEQKTSIFTFFVDNGIVTQVQA